MDFSRRLVSARVARDHVQKHLEYVPLTRRSFCAAVRAGGFYVVPIAKLNIGLLVLYVIMMYLTPFPVVVTKRHGKISEQRPRSPTLHSSGAGSLEEEERVSLCKFITQQVRGLQADDVGVLACAVFVISSIEASNFSRDPVSYSVFNILFETVSAYGCVGVSTGARKKNFSFSGDWHDWSKLVLCIVMLRGRHRGLPASTDYAVRLADKVGHRSDQEGNETGSQEPVGVSFC